MLKELRQIVNEDIPKMRHIQEDITTSYVEMVSDIYVLMNHIPYTGLRFKTPEQLKKYIKKEKKI